MFSILSQPQPARRPIQGDPNYILDFQQLCLGSLFASSNGVQCDPAFSMQHSRCSQKSYILGTRFLDNLLSVHPRHCDIMHTVCLWHKSLAELTHLDDWTILVSIYAVLAVIYAVLAAIYAVWFQTRQGAHESHFRSNCFSSCSQTCCCFGHFIYLTSNIFCWFRVLFVWTAKGESTQLQVDSVFFRAGQGKPSRTYRWGHLISRKVPLPVD